MLLCNFKTKYGLKFLPFSTHVSISWNSHQFIKSLNNIILNNTRGNYALTQNKQDHQSNWTQNLFSYLIEILI